MDTEQQIRLNFLDEAEEYFDVMESNLLGLSSSAIDAQKVDLVLRSAHSVKGGAAMMSLNILSQTAHRLEDFLKILRVRYVADSIEVEVETLLLQGVDSLRNIAELNRQQLKGAFVEDRLEALRDRSLPIFEQLRSRLGDLQTADENALLSQDEDFDPAVLIFEEGVEGVLANFEAQLPQLDIAELAQELSATAQELIGFGNMASLDSFIQLCESIQQQVASVSNTEITSLAEQALKTWKRSYALVLRGSIEKLPSSLEDYSPVTESISSPDLQIDTESVDLSGLQSAFELDTEESTFDSVDTESVDLNNLQSAFELDIEESTFDTVDTESVDLNNLQSAFELDTEESAFNSIDLSGLQSAFELDTEEQIVPVAQSEHNSETESESVPFVENKMVRVPASQLKQFNSLFEQLILNRNSIDLRLEQLQNIVVLMSQRMAQMERSNNQLKQWYDRASIEGLIDTQKQQALTKTNLFLEQQAEVATLTQRFDTLEMDRYSDIHLICQEQIETIVQLQEVASDIELGVREVNQSVRELHYTTRSMQGNVTRTQMLPFANAVKRFPRVIRDLNLQFDKQVKLKIIGEQTLLDRSVIEAISDPLIHLLRNSFDHGIEDTQTRLDRGKAESGTITIRASNQGTYSIITLSDDGGGISVEKIRDRVCQMGMTRAEVAQLPESELVNFIFEPGFSTAQEVTELSGRGVGMDVVRTNLEEVRGDVKVNTQLGKGTTFTLKIPFSLSILRVVIVEQKGMIFAISADAIRELIPQDPETILASDSDRTVSWNQSEIPLIEIEKILTYRSAARSQSLTGSPTIDRTMTLVVGDNTSSVALKISRFWNEQESTVRAIDSPIPLPPGIVSSVLFGDGKVIPLVDPVVLKDELSKGSIAANSDDFDADRTNNTSDTQTILVVDDSINVRRYLSLTLEKAGYRVEQAKDGREALDKLIGGLKVQGIVCDLEMPRLDGYSVLEEIKELPELKELPIIMLTSRSNDKHRKLAMNLGASDYFTKPYNEQELLARLAVLLLNARSKLASL